MDMSKTIESKYLKASDLQGHTVKVVIDSVSMDDLSQEDKPPEIKAVVRLRDRTKGWVLNRQTFLSSIDAAETLHLRLPQSYSVQPSHRA